MKNAVFKILCLQLTLCICGSFIALLGFGLGAAKFVLLGGLCSFIPCTLYALILNLFQKQQAVLRLAVLLIGEMLKVLFSVLFLFAVYRIFRDEMRWVPLIVGLTLSLQANIIALMVIK